MDMWKSFSILALFVISGCSDDTVYIPSYYGPQAISSGTGKAVLPDGSIYLGEFKEGLFEGKGTLKWRNGEEYSGDFKAGLQHGRGVRTHVTGDVYEGEYQEGYESGSGKFTYRNGDHYEGGFKMGMLHGKGLYTNSRGDFYSGNFVENDLSGHGKFKNSLSGDTYEGEFKDWLFDGKGVAVFKRGNRYSGRFKEGAPDGNMVVEYSNGSHYEGGMRGWEHHGHGILRTQDGDVYTGKFNDGKLVGIAEITKNDDERYVGKTKNFQYDGNGKLTKKDGTSYQGAFEHGFYHGHGELITPDGKNYVGELKYGAFNGNGTLVYKDDSGKKISLSGMWASGKYVGDDSAAYVKDGLASVNVEEALYKQPRLVNKALSDILPNTPGIQDMYYVGFAGHGSQDVFMKEARFSARVMKDNYNTEGRSISLINNLKTIDHNPMAIATNLKLVLNGIAAKMDLEEDILFLYITSHGSKDHKISVNLDGLPLNELSAKQLKNILDESKIKWKVVVIAACYSGGFVDVIKDKYTLVMTAARADRQSFGCGDNEELTYFGRAYFEKSLGKGVGLIDAFEQARAYVTKVEKEEKREPSEPQIAFTPAIKAKLSDWQQNLSTAN